MGEIVSADSMQIYRGVDIATAKPTPEELAAVPHHLIGFLPMDRAFSVADYAELARKEINDILSRGKVPGAVRRYGALHQGHCGQCAVQRGNHRR